MTNLKIGFNDFKQFLLTNEKIPETKITIRGADDMIPFKTKLV